LDFSDSSRYLPPILYVSVCEQAVDHGFAPDGFLSQFEPRRARNAAMSVSQLIQPAASRTTEELDLIEELRLRRWARQNYVPPRERSTGWHPVVLDEMRSKDGEGTTGLRSGISTLPPT